METIEFIAANDLFFDIQINLKLIASMRKSEK